MRVTVDLSDEAYHEFAAQATAEHTSIDALLEDRLRKAAGLPVSAARLADRYPLILSHQHDSIDPVGIAEFDLFDPS